MDYEKELHELCETIKEEIAEANKSRAGTFADNFADSPASAFKARCFQ